ncbi:hypothetical protein RGU70_00920 [Herbaspirillum sp. RTI4]|uniref:hypothetical protein n=1 Tax=Herbaspirillum sp. RTI4 TaxID=3048640 RepID=UPI002AB5B6AF|nr:hypothetical protein [Herbaspirillum sp. RTI4]MDY7576888.1 hypothetical protein [Herbaspirillum sp. RTI4]MEA9982505.1 hypothetical protein [Herbaspirillum sp. RTI4]
MKKRSERAESQESALELPVDFSASKCLPLTVAVVAVRAWEVAHPAQGSSISLPLLDELKSAQKSRGVFVEPEPRVLRFSDQSGGIYAAVKKSIPPIYERHVSSPPKFNVHELIALQKRKGIYVERQV